MPHNRIYFVEFFRVFLILCVFLCHLGDIIDIDLRRSIMEFFHTTSWKPWFAVEPFFIMGGFFLYGKIVREKTVHTGVQKSTEHNTSLVPSTSILTPIGRLWMRLMPGVIFCYASLVMLGVGKWWALPFCFLPTGGYGITAEVVGYADWFIGVYFLTTCLFMGVFAHTRKNAWLWICALILFCWCSQVNLKPGKASVLASGGMYYGFLTHNVTRGVSCMGLGMVTAALSKRWHPREGLLLRLIATTTEVLALYMLFCYMYQTSRVHYSHIAVELMVAALLISSAHGWGYISAFLNRFGGIMYVSRYTYSLLLIQGALVSYFHFYHNFGINPHHCTIIIFCAAIPLVLVEYHLIEKWLVPKLKLWLQNAPEPD